MEDNYQRRFNAPKSKKQRIGRKIPRVLKKSEIDALMSVIDKPRDRCALKLMTDCGFRLSEVVYLRIEDIDLSERQILVKQSKGNKDRLVPIPRSSELLVLIPTVRNRRKEGYFLHKSSNKGEKPFSTRAIQRQVMVYSKLAGLEGVHAHTLRHSYASYCAENNVPLEVIRDNLGHSNLATTSIYLHTQTASRREKMDYVQF